MCKSGEDDGGRWPPHPIFDPALGGGFDGAGEFTDSFFEV